MKDRRSSTCIHCKTINNYTVDSDTVGHTEKCSACGRNYYVRIGMEDIIWTRNIPEEKSKLILID